MYILVLINSGEDMGSIDHHPPISFIRLLHLSYFPNRSPDLRSHVLFLLNDVFLSQFQLKCHLTGISLHSNVPPEVRQAVEYLRDCEWPRKFLFLVIAIQELILIDDALGKRGNGAILLF